MILSDIGIRQALRSGRLAITPTPLALQPANLSPDDILIYPGMPIGQLCFYMLDQPCMHPYGS